MHKVKLKKQPRRVVTTHKPWFTFFRRTLLVLIAVGLVGGAYVYGGLSSRIEQSKAAQEASQLKKQISEARAQVDEYKLKIATLETGAAVDRTATEEVRIVNKQLKDEIAVLQEEVALYKGIMAPSLGDQGLNIQEMTLAPTSDTARFRYKLILTQVADNKRFIQGFVGVNIVGVKGGEKTVFSLKDLSPEIKDVDIKFRYRYFQDITGELSLPKDFIPEQVQVIAQATGGRNARVEKAFDWAALETKTNVGQ